LEYGETEKYVFRLRSADGKERDLEVAGLPLGELEKRMGPLRTQPVGPLLSLRFDGEVAVLTVRSFGPRTLSGSGLNYPDFLTQAFQTLLEKKTESLIIDVRDNGGGNDEYGLMLYAHLAPAPFYYYDRLQMNKEKSEFLPRTINPDTNRPLTPLRLDEKGRWVRTDHPNLGLKPPREPVFAGRVFILENGRSFSATGEFMTAVYANKRGVFIGEESGAGITGNTSGIMIGVKLDHSGIVVSIPMVGYYMAGDHGPRPERGILPDHEVIPTVEDILAGRDPVMEFALALARRPGQ
jgi:C-terminal processing protease CtpA/Prc